MNDIWLPLGLLQLIWEFSIKSELLPRLTFQSKLAYHRLHNLVTTRNSAGGPAMEAFSSPSPHILPAVKFIAHIPFNWAGTSKMLNSLLCEKAAEWVVLARGSWAMSNVSYASIVWPKSLRFLLAYFSFSSFDIYLFMHLLHGCAICCWIRGKSGLILSTVNLRYLVAQ